MAYYDQQREQLDPERTVVDTVGDGNDRITVAGRTRHVHGYLEDFLFAPDRARSPVKALSGGERNRLLLARLFTRPANVLVLDEPTNDLDLETLELLEAQLVDWPGTLLLVSHDRRFLDNVVTSTIAFEGDGRAVEYVGGYEDWLRQRPAPEAATAGVSADTRLSAPVTAPIVNGARGVAPGPAAGASGHAGGHAGRLGAQGDQQGEEGARRAAPAHRGARDRAEAAGGRRRGPGLLQEAGRRDHRDDGPPRRHPRRAARRLRPLGRPGRPAVICSAS